MTDLPPFVKLPDEVRLRAREIVEDGMHVEPRRWTGAAAIAAGVIALVVGIVVITPPDKPDPGTTGFATRTVAATPEANQAMVFGDGVDDSTVTECAKGTAVPLAQWQRIASAESDGITLAAFGHADGRRLFCSLTKASVTVSVPITADLGGQAARVLFVGQSGSIAGLTSKTNSLSLTRTGTSAAVAAGVVGDVFLIPRGFADPDRGLTFHLDGKATPAGSLPLSIPPAARGSYSTAERSSPAAKRLEACLAGDVLPVPDAAHYAAGVYAKVTDRIELQLGVFVDRLAVCRSGDVNAPSTGARIISSDLPSPLKTITADEVHYDFKPDGSRAGAKVALVGRVTDSRVASITVDGMSATITNGTYMITGLLPDEKRTAAAKVVVRDASGIVLEQGPDYVVSAVPLTK